MAMTTCKECKAAISTKAESCPNCGAKQKKQNSGCAAVLAIILVIAFLVFASRGCTDNYSNPTTPTKVTAEAGKNAHAAPPTPPPPPTPPALTKPDSALLLANAKSAVSVIEYRFEASNKSLKKYYATADQIKQATMDLAELASIEGTYENSKVKDEWRLSQKAKLLTTEISRQRRALYASKLEQIFVEHGMDVTVRAYGANKDRLSLKYVLMSKPLVYKFENEMKFSEQARMFNFKKIIYTDGYDSTWTENL